MATNYHIFTNRQIKYLSERLLEATENICISKNIPTPKTIYAKWGIPTNSNLNIQEGSFINQFRSYNTDYISANYVYKKLTQETTKIKKTIFSDFAKYCKKREDVFLQEILNSVIEKQGYRRFWIFQAMPERYDLVKELVPGNTTQWLISSYFNEVKEQDIVYFWRGGQKPGIYGVGEIQSTIIEKPIINDIKKTVEVIFRNRYRKPISKEEITSGNQSPNLVGLNILRAPIGTIFKVTTKEAISLNDLIRERGEEAPNYPTKIDTIYYPADSLVPLRIEKTPALIVNAGLSIALKVKIETMDGSALFFLMIALSNSSLDPSQGTFILIIKFFGEFKAYPGYVEQISKFKNIAKEEVNKAKITEEILFILEAARLIAIFSTRNEEIKLRHFLASLLLGGSRKTIEVIDTTCRAVGTSIKEFVDAFIEHTSRSFPNDDSSFWLSQFKSGVQVNLEKFIKNQESINMDNSPEFVNIMNSVANYNNEAISRTFFGRPIPDRPFGKDLLNIKSEVDALAHMFALCSDKEELKNGNNERDTFALGLFGRWGAGKSFFIEKLKEKIKEYSDDAENEKYCKEIIQIDFNAWHYNESNIWASLVHHIFDSLKKHFQKLEKEKEFNNLIKELEISQERREQLNKEINDKKRQRNTIDENIKSRENEINNLIKRELDKIKLNPARLVGNKEARTKLLNLLPDVVDILGLDTDRLKVNLEDNNINAAELRKIMNEAGLICAHAPLISKSFISAGFSVTFLITAGLILFLYYGIPAWLQRPDFWDQYLSSVGQIVAFVTPLMVWFKTRFTKANNLFRQLDGIDSTLREDIRLKKEQEDKVLSSLNEERNRIYELISIEVRRRNDLDNEILLLNNKLDELGSAESLIDYINDRASSDDYRSQLGILALIRRDFEKLSELMTGNHEKEKQTLVNGEFSNELPNIDRIILYIDDLDRVQDSKKVLQVLEAVHLLLAMPLFHVVVAVDERWAASSVLRNHKEFFDFKESSNNNEGNNRLNGKELIELIGSQPATPREFLEKIFQISFWVRPLSIQLTHDLIYGFVNQRNLGVSENFTELELNNKMEEDKDNDDVENVSIGFTEENVNKETEFIEDKKQNDILVEKKNKTIQTIDEKKIIKDEELNINFVIRDEELVSMRALSNVIGRSPRTVKRFINTYRLFKAMRFSPYYYESEDQPENEVIFKNHVPIMILLSIQIGYPDIAVKFFQNLNRAINEDDTQTIEILIQKMRKESLNSEIEEYKWQKALNALMQVTNLYGDESHLKNIIISIFYPWLQPTSRFGFQEWIPQSA